MNVQPVPTSTIVMKRTAPFKLQRKIIMQIGTEEQSISII